MRFIFGLILTCSPLVHAFCQYFPTEFWHKGYLITSNGDTLRGSIKYDFDKDAVQIDMDNRIQTLTARNISYFEIIDKEKENYRQFYSISYQMNMNHKVPRFFEILYLGELTLVAREMIIQETTSSSLSSIYRSQPQLAHKFYFVYKDGKVIDFEGNKSVLYTIMGAKSQEIKSYVKKNNLKTDRLQDLVRITAYYNSI
ncbi:MAG: hypothetical protein O2887_09965 [Bacteroidetes bacterium]|nr:hypothetical protein [Bacteroidota bacterium]MDA1120795.1 hypothetical protein [Bacteroidota bacterium]